MDFGHYLDAVETSSARSRWLTVVLTVATVITFFAYWNSLPFSWLRGRAETATAARELVLASKYQRCELLNDRERGALYRRADALLRNKHWDLAQEPLRIPVSIPITPDTPASGSSGPAVTTGARPVGTLEGEARLDMRVVEVDRYAHELEIEWLHKVIVLDVPFLGIALDVNDLGLLAGLAFVIVLVMRKMSLNSELQNLKITMIHGLGQGQIGETYDLIAMRQVLTVPRPRRSAAPKRYDGLSTGFYRFLTALPDWAPVVMLALVYIRNWSTVDVGIISSPYNTQLSITFSLLFLASVLGLTILCVWTEHRMHRVFDVVVDALAVEGGPPEDLAQRIGDI